MELKEQAQALALALLKSTIGKTPTNFILRKVGKSGIVSRITPSTTTISHNINRYLDFGFYNAIIRDFSKRLEESFPHCNTNNFYENLQKLKLTERDKHILEILQEKLTGVISAGIYNSQKNKITIYKNIEPDTIEEKMINKESTATHELLHMAATYKRGLINITGFNQIFASKYSIGSGINEGYTEHLNVKYFAPREWPHSYITLKLFSEGIEKLVGQEKMEKLYFDGDLEGLLVEIARFSSPEQAVELIRKMDKYQRMDPEERPMLGEKIGVEIANLLTKKYEKEYELGEKTYEEYQDLMVETAFLMSGYKTEKNNGGTIYTYCYDNKKFFIPKEATDIVRNTFFKGYTYGQEFTTMQSCIQYGDLIYCTKALAKAIADDLDISNVEYVRHKKGYCNEYEFVPKEQKLQEESAYADALCDMLVENKSNNQEITSIGKTA